MQCTQLIFVGVLVGTAIALECFTGFKYLAGQSVGTSKETCTSSMDFCYNATADLSQLSNVKVAGCSAARCLLARNKCIKQVISGKEVQFCCCNTGDLCNSKMTNLSFFEKTKQRVKDWTKILG